MVLIIKGSDFYLSAHREGGARTKFLNVAAEISVRPSEGMAEGGFGGNAAFLLPNQNEASPATLQFIARHHRKTLFSLGGENGVRYLFWVFLDAVSSLAIRIARSCVRSIF